MAELCVSCFDVYLLAYLNLFFFLGLLGDGLGFGVSFYSFAGWILFLKYERLFLTPFFFFWLVYTSLRVFLL